MTKANRITAIVQTGIGALELQEFARPTIGPDDAILRVEASGICGSDVSQYDGHYETLGVTSYPFVPGHEPLGVIDEIGERACERWGVQRGDRVAVEPLVPCNHCRQCLDGERNACSGWGRMFSYGFMETTFGPGVTGAFADYMYLHPNTLVHKMSHDLAPEVAVLFNPLGAGVRWAYHSPDLRMGDTILIVGAGQRGLCAVLAAKAAGAGRIIVSDISSALHKLELAKDFGAHDIVVSDREDLVERVQQITGGRLADVVLDVASGAAGVVNDALDAVRQGGTVVLAGLKGGVPIPNFVSDKVVLRSLTLRGVFAVDTASYREAIRLLESGDPLYARMHSDSFSLKDTEQAILRQAGRLDGPPAIHVAVLPGLDR